MDRNVTKLPKTYGHKAFPVATLTSTLPSISLGEAKTLTHLRKGVCEDSNSIRRAPK
jgi:hypothetical protein